MFQNCWLKKKMSFPNRITLALLPKSINHNDDKYAKIMDTYIFLTVHNNYWKMHVFHKQKHDNSYAFSLFNKQAIVLYLQCRKFCKYKSKWDIESATKKKVYNLIRKWQRSQEGKHKVEWMWKEVTSIWGYLHRLHRGSGIRDRTWQMGGIGFHRGKLKDISKWP